MDFEKAAQRLAKDHSKLQQQQQRGHRRRSAHVSAQAQREVEERRRQQAVKTQQKQRQEQEKLWAQEYFRQGERALRVKSLVASSPIATGTTSHNSLLLMPVSIYGEGDKIALPPSVLQTLTAADTVLTTAGGSSTGEAVPWMFRVGIRHPHHVFPASPLWAELARRKWRQQESEGSDQPVRPLNEEEDDDEEEEEEKLVQEAYLDELRHKYIAYTYCTVVEFTQEEGCIGLPQAISAALLDPRRRHRSSSGDAVIPDIPIKRTVDPAQRHGPDEQAMDVDPDQTAGHLAWGAFDIPDVALEVSLVQLPKGKACTLLPTDEALRQGFYGLKDIKLVLEQSLLRTRATLSVGDVVHTWHRGTQYDVRVTSVVPGTYQAVTCINTDMEVEFQEAELSSSSSSASNNKDSNATLESTISTSEKGKKLGSASTTVTSPNLPSPAQRDVVVELAPEPPAEQIEGVCTIQIRADGSQGRRRFDVQSGTMKDLFGFAASVSGLPIESGFRLVTRFPRRVLSFENPALSLIDAGIKPGQELLLVERL